MSESSGRKALPRQATLDADPRQIRARSVAHRLCQRPKAAEEIIETVNGPPVVIKLPEGTLGVEMLRSNHGSVIMEVNSSPGFEGIEKATGKDVAGQIITFIEANAKAGKTKTKGKG